MFSEQGFLRISIFATVTVAAFGIVFGLLSGSFSIAFDGAYSLGDAGMTILALWVSSLIVRSAKADALSGRLRNRFTMGFWHLEPIVFGLNGTLLIAVASYALMVGFVRNLSRAVRSAVFLQSMVAISVTLLSAGTQAGEQEIAPSAPPPPPLAATPGVPFDVAFGIALTTDYVSRGITNSNSEPAIQGYVEPSIELPNIGAAYVNIWSSNVDYGVGFEGAEIDVAAGMRPEFGPLSLDVGYVHYFYTPEHVSPDYGEIFAKADYNVEDMFTVGGRVFFAPDFNQSGNTATWVAGGVRAPLPHDFSAYAGVGYQFIDDPAAFEQLAWMAGVSYSWKSLTFDVRYWGTDLSDEGCTARSGFPDGCDDRVVATISFDTSWSKVRDWLSNN